MTFDEAKSILPEDIYSRIKLDPSGCWLWMGKPVWPGYGRRYYQGKVWKAHRLIYTLLIRDVPKHKPLDHLCRVKLCVNPDHLEVVTHSINNFRRDIPNRHKTHCPRGHEYTEENTYWQGTRRSCLTCRQTYRKRSTEKALALLATIEGEL